MKFSSLQQFILLKVLERGSKVERNNFRSFYRLKKTKEKYQEEIITKSLMSLIDRGFAVGYGRRTSCKWFITHVKLTKQGIKKAIEILESKQSKLPL